MKLTLIRHGLTEGNLRRLYYGSTDLPLTPQGIAALQELKHTFGYPTAEVYYTSGIRRTEETFAQIFGDLPHSILPGMREMDFGSFEMKSYDMLKDNPEFQTWISGDIYHNCCPGGESAMQVTDRALRALAPVLEAGRDALCVTHGGVIANLLCTWFPGSNYYDCLPEPGHGVQIFFSGSHPESYTPVPMPAQ